MKTAKLPKYSLHRATGQAKVRVNGTDHYLGAYGSDDSRARYDKLMAESFGGATTTRAAITVDELCLQYLAYAEVYYRDAAGNPTSEVASLRSAMRHLIRLFGTIKAGDFTPTKLAAVQRAMADAGQCRTGINYQVNRIRRVWRWGVAGELIRSQVYEALRALPALKAGRTKAAEKKPIGPVEQSVVDATLPHLPQVVADMVRLQLLTGCRPGEICSMRPGDIDRSGDVWTYRPASHKTAWRGKERRIFLGPQAQEILLPYLVRPADCFCFSPMESEAKRNEARRAGRQSPMTPSQASREPKDNPKRTPTDRYTKDSYARAIIRACEVAFDMPAELKRRKGETAEAKAERLAKARQWRAENVWRPNRLRHARATMLRKEFGIEGAAVVLGHSELSTAEIYAEKDFAAAERIMAQVG